MTKTNLFLLFFVSIFLVGCSSQSFKKNADGVEISVQSTSQKVRLQVINEKIIRVSATPEKNFSTEKSLMIVPQEKKADFTVEEKDNLVALHTDSLQVPVDKSTGEVVFMNKNGEIILQENAGGGKSFSPIEV